MSQLGVILTWLECIKVILLLYKRYFCWYCYHTKYYRRYNRNFPQHISLSTAGLMRFLIKFDYWYNLNSSDHNQHTINSWVNTLYPIKIIIIIIIIKKKKLKEKEIKKESLECRETIWVRRRRKGAFEFLLIQNMSAFLIAVLQKPGNDESWWLEFPFTGNETKLVNWLHN